MSRRARLWLFMCAGALLAVVLGFALAGLPDYDAPLGRYAQIVTGTAVSERQATNSVITVAFDYRALDTLGEELMVFLAAVGTSVLLRTGRGEEESGRISQREERRAPETSDAVRALGTALAPLTVLLGVYVVTHGHLSPGGGFQGGVILAAALIYVFVAGRRVLLGRIPPVALMEAAEAAGAAGFVLIGVGGLLFATAFLENFLPFGTKGSLLSGGAIPLSNIAVGIEVAGALAVVLEEFLGQVVLKRGGDR